MTFAFIISISFGLILINRVLVKLYGKKKKKDLTGALTSNRGLKNKL
jgi:hypothetical protein